MKLRFFTLSLLMSVLSLLATAQTSQPLVGIVTVYDEITHLNYNQLFKKVVQENVPLVDGAAASADLVEHPAQAAAAVSVRLYDQYVIAAYYKNGKPTLKDTFAVAGLEQAVEINVLEKILLPGAEGFTVAADISPTSPEYQWGLRPGDILLKVRDQEVAGDDDDQLRKLLDGKKDEKIMLTVRGADSWQERQVIIPRRAEILREWKRPLAITALQHVFMPVLKRMEEPATGLGVKFKKGPKYKMKTLAQFAPPANGKSSAHLLMPLCRFADLHPVGAGLELDELFTYEHFDELKKPKKELPGDAALHVFRYYNLDRRSTHLGKSRHVSADVKNAVRKLSGPFYNKPGVFANYYLAAWQYESAKNYPAALNQYYALLFKVDELLVSELKRVQLKQTVFARIAHCAAQLGQPEYARLAGLARDCLGLLAGDEALGEQDEQYYEFSKKILDLSHDIESKLAQQRSEKRNAIIGAVLNAAAGVASFDVDMGLAFSFLSNSASILETNSAYNFSVNSTLSRVTNSIQVNLPPELQEEESNPYELVITSAIAYAVERAADKSAILGHIVWYAAAAPELKEAAEDVQRQHRAGVASLDHAALVNRLIQREKIVYRYEKRGLKVPEKPTVP